MHNEKMSFEAIVRDFENNNEEFIKIIRTTVEVCIRDNLSDAKQVLDLAVFSALEQLKTILTSIVPFCTNQNNNRRS
jgi:hypothetical protein